MNNTECNKFEGIARQILKFVVIKETNENVKKNYRIEEQKRSSKGSHGKVIYI